MTGSAGRRTPGAFDDDDRARAEGQGLVLTPVAKMTAQAGEDSLFRFVQVRFFEAVDHRELELRDALARLQREERTAGAERNDRYTWESDERRLRDDDQGAARPDFDELHVRMRGFARGRTAVLLFEERDDRPGRIGIDLLQPFDHIVRQRDRKKPGGPAEFRGTSTFHVLHSFAAVRAARQFSLQKIGDVQFGECAISLHSLSLIHI